jgi:dienelactone hydrolase
MRGRWFQSVPLAMVAVVCSGCLPALPENAKPADQPNRTILLEVPQGRIQTEEGVNGAVWLEVDRPGGGEIGGYLSQNDSPTKSLVIILHGASTFSPNGELGSALVFHETMGSGLQGHGFVTWSLAYPECGTAYGQDDLQAVVDAIDWLDRVGQSTLGFHRIYVAGYSTGGTLSILANRQRSLCAAASISGLTEPESIETLWGLFKWITGIYPVNLGACQMRQTLEFYGPPGAEGWRWLDSVSHFSELKNPMIVLHGTEDPLFSVANASHLEAAYQEALGGGWVVPEMQFVYLEDESHFPDVRQPAVLDPIVEFFDRHFTMATQPAE